MIEEMKLRNFASATQKSYLYALATLAKYYKRPPDQLDKEQMFDFTEGTHPISRKGTTEIGGAKRRSDLHCLH
jgi:hypothetical protein